MLHRIQRLCHALVLLVFLSACANPSGTESISPAQTVFHLDTTALSYGIFETEATSVSIDVHNTIPNVFKSFGDISIEDGSGIATYKVKPGESTIVHVMPAGKKQVMITAGGQLLFNGEIRGAFIQKITFDSSASQLPLPEPRIVVYGDSLTVGGKVDNLSAEAWPVLLRKHYCVIVEAHGYRSLYDDAATPAERAGLVSKISSWLPDDIWLAIGLNDYESGQWSAQEFGEAYAATLDALHASNPQALVFAQSPIRRAVESPNSFGDDLQSYRNQIESACVARAAWCTFVDGTNPEFPQPNELNKDGVHLTTQSSAKYAEAVLHIIGK